VVFVLAGLVGGFGLVFGSVVAFLVGGFRMNGRKWQVWGFSGLLEQRFQASIVMSVFRAASTLLFCYSTMVSVIFDTIP
jgi:hypothetical protein